MGKTINDGDHFHLCHKCRRPRCSIQASIYRMRGSRDSVSPTRAVINLAWACHRGLLIVSPTVIDATGGGTGYSGVRCITAFCRCCCVSHACAKLRLPAVHLLIPAGAAAFLGGPIAIPAIIGVHCPRGSVRWCQQRRLSEDAKIQAVSRVCRVCTAPRIFFYASDGSASILRMHSGCGIACSDC